MTTPEEMRAEGKDLYLRARRAGFTIEQSLVTCLAGLPKWAKPEMVRWRFVDLEHEITQSGSPTQKAALHRLIGVKQGMNALRETLPVSRNPT